MIEIRSQVYRRRIDRTSPTGRSREWVQTVSQPVKRLDPDTVHNFLRIQQRCRPQQSQHTTS